MGEEVISVCTNKDDDYRDSSSHDYDAIVFHLSYWRCC